MKAEIVRGDPLVVRVEGEIDYGSEDELNSALDSAFDESPDGYVIDLSGVFFIGSTGLQAILAIYNKVIKTGGHIALVIVHPNAREIFFVLNIDKLPNLFICDSIEAAKIALSKV